MRPDNRLFDDLARLMSGAMGAAAGIRGELEGVVRQRMERIAADLDLVGREQFEAVQAMAAKARAEQEELTLKVAELERRIEQLEGRPPPRRRAAGPPEEPGAE